MFKKQGWVWKNCPYIIWVLFSVLKSLVIWNIPVTLYHLLGMLFIVSVYSDGSAEARMKKEWAKIIKMGEIIKGSDGEESVYGVLICQVVFVVATGALCASLFIGHCPSSMENTSTAWGLGFIMGIVLLILSQLICWFALADIQIKNRERSNLRCQAEELSSSPKCTT